ncbi:MAG: hypothetical protein RXO54_08400 [Acidilobus sp.]
MREDEEEEVGEQELKWESVGILHLKGMITDDVADAVRELIAREVFKKVSTIHVGMLGDSGAIEMLQPSTDHIMVAVNAIGGYRGVVRVNYIMERGATGLTLSYWLMEGARTAEGLRVRVAVGRGGRIDFIVEGVVQGA